MMPEIPNEGQILHDAILAIRDEAATYMQVQDGKLMDAINRWQVWRNAQPDPVPTPTPTPVPTPTPAVRHRGFNAHGVWQDSTGRWTQGPSQDWFDKVKAAGGTEMRVGLKWEIVEPSKGRFNQDYLTALDTTIARCKQAGLSVMLNVIHLFNHGGFPTWAAVLNGVASISANGQGYTTMLATRYKDNTTVVGYDINEPDLNGDFNGCLRMYDKWIGWIRATGSTQTAYIESPWGNSDPTGGDPAILTNKTNVAYSSHCYYSGGDRYGFDGTTGYNGYTADLRAWLDKRLAWCKAAGIGMHLGEIGIGEGATNRDKWIADVTAWANEKSVDTVWWELFSSNQALSAMDRSYVVKPYIAGLFK